MGPGPANAEPRILNAQSLPLLGHMAEHGWVCVSINYRLSPRATWPDHIVDVKRALAWTKANIAGHGGDPGFVAVTGGSAGGHLAAMCLQTDWAGDYGLPADPLRGAWLVSGLYDLAPLRWSWRVRSPKFSGRSWRKTVSVSQARLRNLGRLR